MCARTARIALNLMFAAAFAAVFLIPAVIETAPVGGFVAESGSDRIQRESVAAAKPDNTPTRVWGAGDFPGRSAVKDGVPVDAVVVVRHDGTAERQPFDEGYAVTHDDDAGNDLWVVGGCHEMPAPMGYYSRSSPRIRGWLARWWLRRRVLRVERALAERGR